MLVRFKIGFAKFGGEGGNKFILWPLRQGHLQQLKPAGNFTLADIVGKSKITGETEIEIIQSKTIQLAVIESLHPESMNGLHFMAFQSKCYRQFARQIFVQQDFHAG